MTQPHHHDQLSAYLDGELEDAEVARLEAELRVNATLRAELEEIREVSAFLREVGPVRAPRGFHGRVMAAVEAEAPTPPWWAWLRRPFGLPLEGIAVALAAAAVLWIALPDRTRSEPSAGKGDAAGKEAVAGLAPEAAGVEEEADGDAVAIVDLGPQGAEGGSASGGEAAPPDRKGALPDKGAKPAPKKELAVARADEEAKAGPGAKADAEAKPAGVKPADTKVDSGEKVDPGAKASDLRAVGYRYRLTTADPTLLGSLQRIADRHGGLVHDGTGARTQGSRQSEAVATYGVRLPSEALSRFHRDLERLGVALERETDPTMFADSQVEISVTLVLTGAANGADEALPSGAIEP